ncbi:hypothetical protein [Streptomyces genisteinicus]|uniref:Cobyrinic acid a,c-diamide synthase n=1 Tax=Streptomyces genisteinicus TaxID=2768068 RepID=A0A7H0HPY2_9ACTN|nr:hypothetical protein [Streptomyces genisteinicus]QNP62598.1 hypothetical protein IAG43_06360 [Streptomyces genisteinicus]
MSRRVSLPGADELFRTTGGTGLTASSPRKQASGEPRVPAPAGESDPSDRSGSAAAPRSQEHAPAADPEAPGEERGRGTEAADAATGAAKTRRAPGTEAAATGAARRRGRGANRRPSGRERHDEKITVYVSAEELMDLEHARLVLRGEHGLAVDRGRIVREAVAVVLADLEQRGDASILVRRLRGR